jgi:hypothetical protein
MSIIDYIQSSENNITMDLERVKNKIDRLEKKQDKIPSWFQGTTLTFCLANLILIIIILYKLNKIKFSI